ncbi:hypothetical protein E3J79_00765 [Candidatus Dependentiae bacterium]|nr:MAG: hypothetical protein E3J79_00765 [Candidatus Dependentiae bacterium]
MTIKIAINPLTLLVTVNCLASILGWSIKLEAKTPQIRQKISRQIQQRRYINELNNFIKETNKFISEGETLLKSQKENQTYLRKINGYLEEIPKIIDRLTLLQVRLSHSNAEDFYNLLNRSYKEDISEAAQELHRYRAYVSVDPKKVYNFLTINYPEFRGYKTENWLKMSYKPIKDRVRESMESHAKINTPLDQAYVRFLRQIESLFRNEIVKQDYDAYLLYLIDPSLLKNLLVDSKSERKKLTELIGERFNTLFELKNSLLEKRSEFKRRLP